MYKLYAALGLIAVLLAGLGWHKHVVSQRDHARAEVTEWTAKANAFKAALTSSEKLRQMEFDAAKQDAVNARKSADTRVAEARRSAGAIKKIVEKPHVLTSQGCPVPDLVSADELRDALQPNPFGAAPAAEPDLVPSAPAGTTPAAWSDPGAAYGGPGGLRLDVELDVGSPGVGQGAGPWSAGEGQLPGV